jgi:D-arginine dehydrogenase
LWVASEPDIDALDSLEIGVREFVHDAERIDGKRAVQLCPVLDPSWVRQALVEPGASDIDVSAVHQGYIRGFRKRGGVIHRSAKVVEMSRASGTWRVVAQDGTCYEAPVLVNAAGAWGDEVGRLAGAKPVGLHPMLRNVFIVAKPKVPEDCDFKHLPLVHDVASRFYFKPEGDSLLCSPADEIPSEPCDAKPDVESIALALDYINEATTLDAHHVRNSWAGLRTFVADRTPIAGFDSEIEGFFWLVGQGGYGIETSPALSRTAAKILTDSSLPDDIEARGLAVSDLHRRRLDGVTESVGH